MEPAILREVITIPLARSASGRSPANNLARHPSHLWSVELPLFSREERENGWWRRAMLTISHLIHLNVWFPEQNRRAEGAAGGRCHFPAGFFDGTLPPCNSRLFSLSLN